MEDEKTIKKFIITLIVVILLVVGVYLFTKYVLNKDKTNNAEETTKEITVDTSKAIVGTMLNKSEASYYVILYDYSSSKAQEYSNLIQKYSATEKALKVYKVDLGSGMNSKYVDKEHTNTTTSNLDELRFGDITVLKIEKGAISKSYESVDAITKVWNIS